MDDFKSGSPDILWPALTGPQAAQLFTLLYQLERTQWWTEEQLARAQRRQLKVLLFHTLKTVPYYRSRFPERPVAELLEQWSELPILARSDIQEAGSALNSTNMPPALGKVIPVQTSGSMGRPVGILWNSTNQLFWMAFTLREHLWHQRDPSGVLACIRPDRKPGKKKGGADLPDWGPPVNLLYDTGPSAILDSGVDIDTQLKWLRKRRPSYLLSLPSNIQALAETSLAANLGIDSLKGIISFGEVLDPKTRDACGQAWGVTVSDLYSAQEIGYIALQCPLHDHYHLQAENVYVEILDESGKPCQPGETGRLILTPLHSFATPLIRYENQDYVEVGEPCPCGRGLPVITRILGRQRNLATSPDGRRFWPSFPAEDWMHIAPIRQIQLVQKSRNRILVRMAVTGALQADEEAELSGILRKSLGHPYEFSFHYLEKVPRNRNGKYEDFISEVED